MRRMHTSQVFYANVVDLKDANHRAGDQNVIDGFNKIWRKAVRKMWYLQKYGTAVTHAAPSLSDQSLTRFSNTYTIVKKIEFF